MKVKKILIGIMFVLCAFQASCLAENVSQAATKGLINQYKAQNYLGCVQNSEKIIKANPSNIFAYYYQGLAYLQLGKKEQALSAFEKVQALNSNKILVDYATTASSCLNNPEQCKKDANNGNDLDAFIKSNKFYDKSVQSEVNKKKLERMKDTINDELSPKKSEMPTNDEIAEAVKTLAKAGINPMAGNMNAMGGMYAQSPEMMQANMLLGNNNGSNNSNNMLPMLLMSQQNGQKVSPELIQTMMMSQMTPDFGGNSSTY